MPTAEIITIGTEILLGEIQDTNARYFADKLRNLGIDLFRITSVGDNRQRIAAAIRQALESSEIVLTSGGLGPTIDDMTREAVADATGVITEFKPELWEQIKARFQRFGVNPTENNKRQAYIPQGSIPIENPVGTAPAFIVKHAGRVIISLPGVPRELEYLMENAVFPYLKESYNLLGTIATRLLHTAGVGESQIDSLIADLEQLSNPTVGLAAHAGQVDVRITAKAASPEIAEELISPIEITIRERLGDWIYGSDSETLEDIVSHDLAVKGWRLGVFEAGLGGRLIKRLASVQGSLAIGEFLGSLPDPDELTEVTRLFRQTHSVDVALGVVLYPRGEKHELHITLITPGDERTIRRSYGGSPLLAPTWAANLCLDLLRKIEK